MHRIKAFSICLSVLSMVGAGAYEFGDHTISRLLDAAYHCNPLPIDPLVPPLQLTPSSESFSHFSHDPQAESHPHGERRCRSGCAVSRHPTERLTPTAFAALLEAYQQSPPTGENGALEEILFFGRQSRKYWCQQRFDCDDPVWQRVLDDELEKTHALVSLRVMDEAGRICSQLNDVRVPLDRRHVFQMQSEGLPPLVTSGTVKRVGLDYLWTRL